MTPDGTSNSDRRYIQALDEVTVPMTIISADGTVDVVNAAFADLTGYEPSELAGETPGKFLHESDRDTWQSQIELLTEAVTDDTSGFFTRFVTKTGSEKPVEIELSAVRDGGDDLQGVICRAWDVRQQDQQEQQLEILNRVLRHNIRNQMNLVMINSRFLQEHDQSDLKTAAATIEDVAQEVINLSEKARMAQDYLGIPPEEDCQTDLVEATKTVIDKFDIRYANATVETDLPDEALALAPPSYEVALMELMENAIVYSDGESGTVRVEIEPGEDTHTVHVKDNCPPIPDDVKGTIQQGRELPLEHNDGLGLWIVTWMAGTVGGEVRFETREGMRGNDIQLVFESLDE